jgi:hypothetical protein
VAQQHRYRRSRIVHIVLADALTNSPDLQFHYRHDFHLASPELVPDMDAPGFTFAPMLLKPKSIGSVLMRSNNPLEPARICGNYLTSASVIVPMSDQQAITLNGRPANGAIHELEAGQYHIVVT